MNYWKNLIIGFLILSSFVFTVVYKPVYSQEPNLSAVEIAKQFLRDYAAEYSLRSDLSDLKFLETVSSLDADHVRFQQLYQSIPVYGNYVSVSVSEKVIRSPQVTNQYDSSITLQSIVPQTSADDASINAQTSVGVKGELRGSITTELVIYPQEILGKYMRYVLAWEVKIPAREPLGDWDVFMDATTGKTLEKFNRLVFSNQPSSNAPTSTKPEQISTSTPRSIIETPPLDRRPQDIFLVIKSVIWKIFEPVVNLIRGVKSTNTTVKTTL